MRGSVRKGVPPHVDRNKSPHKQKRERAKMSGGQGNPLYSSSIKRSVSYTYTSFPFFVSPIPRLFFAILSLAQPSLSLGIKTLLIHVPPHHRVQPRMDGGVEEVGAQGGYVQVQVDGTEAGPRAVASLECGFGLGASLMG
jgi:hypothetical protein